MKLADLTTILMYLTREDQIRFAEALINPPTPNERLTWAAKRHAELIVNDFSASRDFGQGFSA